MAEAVATTRTNGYGEYSMGLKTTSATTGSGFRRNGYSLGRQPSSRSIPDSDSDDDMMVEGRGNSPPPPGRSAPSSQRGVGSSLSFASETSSFYDPPVNAKWHCQSCTYENADRKNAKCALCGEKREDAWSGIPLAPPPFGGAVSPAPVADADTIPPAQSQESLALSSSASTASSQSSSWETSAKGSLNRFLQHGSRGRSGKSRSSKSSASSVVSEGSTSTVRASNIRHVRPMHDGGSTAGPSKPSLSEAIVEEEYSGEEYLSDENLDDAVKSPSPPPPATLTPSSSSNQAPPPGSRQPSQQSLTSEQSKPSRLRAPDAIPDDASSYKSGSSHTRSSNSAPSPRVGRKSSTEPGLMTSPRSLGLGTLVQSGNGVGRAFVPQTSIQRGVSSGTSSSGRSALDSSVHSQSSRKVPIPHDSSDEGPPNHRASLRKVVERSPPGKHGGSGGILGIHLATSFRGGSVPGGSVSSAAKRDNSSVDTQRTSQSMPVMSSTRNVPPRTSTARFARRPSNHSVSSEASQSIDPSVQSGRTSATGRAPAPDPSLDHAQPRRMSGQSARSNLSNQAARERVRPKYTPTPSSRVVPIIHSGGKDQGATEHSVEVAEKMLKTPPPDPEAEFDDELGSLQMVYGAPSVIGAEMDVSSRDPASTAAVYDCETSVSNRGTTSSTVAATYDGSSLKRGLPNGKGLSSGITANGNSDLENPEIVHQNRHLSAVSGLTTADDKTPKEGGWLRCYVFLSIVVLVGAIIIVSIVLATDRGSDASTDPTVDARSPTETPATETPVAAPTTKTLTPTSEQPIPVFVDSPAPTAGPAAPEPQWEPVMRIEGLRIGDEAGHSVSMSSDGDTLAVGSKGPVRLYRRNKEDGTWQKLYDLLRNAWDDEMSKIVSLAGGGQAVAVSNPAFGIVRVYDIIDGEAPLGKGTPIRPSGDIVALSLGEDGRRLAVGMAAGEEPGSILLYELDDDNPADEGPTWRMRPIEGELEFTKMDLVLVDDMLAFAGYSPRRDNNQVGVIDLSGDRPSPFGGTLDCTKTEFPSVDLSLPFLAVGSDHWYVYDRRSVGDFWVKRDALPHQLVSLAADRLVYADQDKVKVAHLDADARALEEVDSFEIEENVRSLDHVWNRIVVGDPSSGGRGVARVYELSGPATPDSASDMNVIP